jgi:iron complex outermembrane receptor protein
MIGGGDLAKDKWNGFVNLEFSKNDETHYRDRSRDWIGKGDTRQWGYDPLASQWTPGLPHRLDRERRNLAGSCATAGPAAPGHSPRPAHTSPQAVTPAIAGDSGCSYDIGQFRSFLPELEAMQIFARGTYAFSGSWEAYGELATRRTRPGST